MLDSIRKPFLIVAIILLTLAVLAELGSAFYIDANSSNGAQQYQVGTPGLGIPYLALLDGLLLFTLALIGLSLIIPERIHGRIQGIATFIVALLTLLGGIVMLIAAIGLLMLMISLLMAIPFGTIVYFAVYADFDTTPAAITLSLIMFLKLGFCIFLILAHQRFLQNKGLVLMILTSLLATIILNFLHSLVPGFLVSITDDIGAIIITILAIIWSIVFLIGSIPSVIKALRVDRALR